MIAKIVPELAHGVCDSSYALEWKNLIFFSKNYRNILYDDLNLSETKYLLIYSI